MQLKAPGSPQLHINVLPKTQIPSMQSQPKPLPQVLPHKLATQQSHPKAEPHSLAQTTKQKMRAPQPHGRQPTVNSPSDEDVIIDSDDEADRVEGNDVPAELDAV